MLFNFDYCIVRSDYNVIKQQQQINNIYILVDSGLRFEFFFVLAIFF